MSIGYASPLGVQMLQETTDKGTVTPSSVNLLIQFHSVAIWNTEFDITTRKITTQYLASVVADNLPPRPFSVRMVRVIPDSTTDRLQNKTLWSSYTEIIDIRQGYPRTKRLPVCWWMREQFGSQQVTRNYHPLRGRIFRSPQTMTRIPAILSGLCGAFNRRTRITRRGARWITDPPPVTPGWAGVSGGGWDKWALYAIAQYCDQPVPDGFGGTEPRMTLNAYITTQRKAYDVLADFLLGDALYAGMEWPQMTHP